MQELREFIKNALSKVDFMHHVTGLAVIALMMAVAWSIMFRSVPEGNKELFSHLIGIVEGSFVGGIVQYYYGKSKQEKPPQP